MARRSLGRRFGWLWAAFAASSAGTMLAFGAFPLIAIRVLDAGPEKVSALAAAGLAVGAAVAVPSGPWVEFRRKRPVMIAMDLARFAALLTIPAAYALGLLSFVQLVVVSVVVAGADITFRAASGACLKALVSPADLVVATGRFESTTWTATALGPPLGGVLIGVFGPVATVLVDAVSYLLSALGIRAIGGDEPRPVRTSGSRLRAHDRASARESCALPSGRAPADLAEPPTGRYQARRGHDLLDGWRYVLAHPVLRRLFANTILVNGLIMATEPLLAVLMLGRLGFPPWQYGLAFAVPCAGGLVASRLSARLVARFGRDRVLLVTGALRACWPVGLAFIRPGVGGLLLVMVVELGLIACIGVFNPVYSAYRLDQLSSDLAARGLSAWTVTTKASIAVLTAVWGVLAAVTSPRIGIAVAGVLLLATPFLLRTPKPELSVSGVAIATPDTDD